MTSHGSETGHKDQNREKNDGRPQVVGCQRFGQYMEYSIHSANLLYELPCQIRGYPGRITLSAHLQARDSVFGSDTFLVESTRSKSPWSAPRSRGTACLCLATCGMHHSSCSTSCTSNPWCSPLGRPSWTFAGTAHVGYGTLIGYPPSRAGTVVSSLQTPGTLPNSQFSFQLRFRVAPVLLVMIG